MGAAYENDRAICDEVAVVVPTYHPAPNGAQEKDATYKALHKEAVRVS